MPEILFLLWLQANVADWERSIRESGRLAALVEPPSERIAERRAIAPGAPPVLAFRYLEGRERHRFGQLDLVLDDAGH